MNRKGFTLVEVIVAIVVLEVGLLGVVGTLVLAAGNMRRAVSLERAVTEVELVYDSLTSAPSSGSGTASVPGGRLRWSVSTDGTVRVDALASSDSVLFTVLGRAVPVAAP
ncbi:MAG: prepilin-type N-terminal cleavage/methylation domain-containing protein [Gemmatimonadetes bacterium]|nr:prepilin-type N-terminal cleavage/methylation domain-containing protein [Gemmatimonadota bacterium]